MSEAYESEAYENAWRASIQNPAAFWGEAAKAIDWFTPPAATWDEAEGWYAGGRLNTAWNCLDRHVAAGRGDALALSYDSPVTDVVQEFTYSQLLEETGRVAAMLAPAYAAVRNVRRVRVWNRRVASAQALAQQLVAQTELTTAEAIEVLAAVGMWIVKNGGVR